MKSAKNHAIGAVRSYRHERNIARLSRLFAESASRVPSSRSYSTLNTFSLAASSIRPRPKPASVNLILPELRPGRIFAGVRTAIEFGCGTAAALNSPLRLLVLWAAPTGRDVDSARRFLEEEFGFRDDVEILPIEALAGFEVADDDIWIGTHWTTVHPLDVASRLGVIDPTRVIYLIQDYEPGFSPWSTESALARATYHARFTHIVNSAPLKDYLERAEGIEVDESLVFAPSLDLARLERAAVARRASPVARIMFYGRPSKPRNLFDIGISALSLAARSLERSGQEASFVSAGEEHSSVVLGDRTQLAVRGKIAWQHYFSLLAESDVVVSLQLSPHPSHPPLDAVVSGAFAVTNDLAGTRSGRHGRLNAVEPDPVALATAITDSVERARNTVPAAFDSTVLHDLGRELRSVVATVASRLGAVS